MWSSSMMNGATMEDLAAEYDGYCELMMEANQKNLPDLVDRYSEEINRIIVTVLSGTADEYGEFYSKISY